MDQIKKAGELAQLDTQENDIEKSSRDVRTLNDLEMVLVGGGECVVCW